MRAPGWHKRPHPPPTLLRTSPASACVGWLWRRFWLPTQANTSSRQSVQRCNPSATVTRTHPGQRGVGQVHQEVEVWRGAAGCHPRGDRRHTRQGVNTSSTAPKRGGCKRGAPRVPYACSRAIVETVCLCLISGENNNTKLTAAPSFPLIRRGPRLLSPAAVLAVSDVAVAGGGGAADAARGR